MTEGWGGTARKLHWIINGNVLCGRRVGPSFEPIIDPSIDPAKGTHNFCKYCMKHTGTTPVIILEMGWSIDYGRPAAARS